jgi:pSer/pThr/pTyr-binding forkhead associated (FHA) protein
VEQSPNELTTTLHLSPREFNLSPAGILEEYVASLEESDRSVIEEIQSSDGDKAMVLIHRGENKGSRYLVTKDGITIGRSTTSGIFLDDVTVSRAHAAIEKSDTGYYLRDSGSLNGTYVNSTSINEVELRSGDEIQIGKFHLLFVTGRTSEKH